MRIQLFEFEDLSWFPDIIRRGGTDFLRYFLNVTRFYSPVAPLLLETLTHTGEIKIIDLCSGGGGPVEAVSKELAAIAGTTLPIYLTDRFPNIEAYQYIKEKSSGAIDYINFPVDATDVPNTVTGFRTMFSAIHHFTPETIQKVLKNAVESKSGIGIFDSGDKNILTILGIILFHPVLFFFYTPFFRPFSLSRLFYTYIIPLIPIYTIWDGTVSILRLYHHSELLNIAKEYDAYEWKSGKVKNSLGMSVAYLIGYPK
jgi:hypothetical protein